MRLPRLFLRVSLIASAATLAACGTLPDKILSVEPRTVVVAPPPNLLKTDPAPVPPTTAGGNVIYQDAVARYLVDLSEAHRACVVQVDAIRSFVEKEKARVAGRDSR